MPLLRVASAVTLPFQLNYVEGPLLGVAVRVARGLGAYLPPTAPPYAIAPYGPIPYYLVALCVKVFGVGFAMPRILAVASGVWCATLVGRLVRLWGGTPQVGLAFGLLYLTTPVMMDWLFLLRVDLIGLAFSLTGLYIFAQGRRWSWYLSAPFFVAGLFCKFTLVAAPLACFLHAALGKDGKRKALGFGAYNLALGALAFEWAQRRTGGWFAFHTIWSLSRHSYSVANLAKSLQFQAKGDYFLLVLALFLAYGVRSQPDLRLPLIYLGFSFLSSLAVGKLGSASNYFLEWEAALCVCAGLGYNLLRARADFESAAAALWPAALALLVMVNLRNPRPAPFSSSGCREAYAYVKTYPGGPILSENVGAVIIAGKTPLVLDTFSWTQEVEQRGWPGSEVVDLIRARQVGLILLGSDVENLPGSATEARWPPSVTNAIRENYRLVDTFGCLDAHAVYQPRPLP